MNEFNFGMFIGALVGLVSSNLTMYFWDNHFEPDKDNGVTCEEYFTKGKVTTIINKKNKLITLQCTGEMRSDKY